MAMYYKWRRRTYSYVSNKDSNLGNTPYYLTRTPSNTTILYKGDRRSNGIAYEPEFNSENGTYDFSHVVTKELSYGETGVTGARIDEASFIVVKSLGLDNNFFCFLGPSSAVFNSESGIYITGNITNRYYSTMSFSGSSYVYNTNGSAYPNGGIKGSYYYDQRTTITSPTVASNLTYSESINVMFSSSIQLQWTGAQSNTSYPVTQYEVSYAINNTDSWQVAGTTGVLTYEFSSIPKEATSIAFRVRAKDSNGQYGDYVTGTYSTISRESPITVTTRTIEMNYFNGTDYEILYPVVGSEVYNNVKSGNYIGSGQFGQSNPSSLEFEFTPKMVMIAKTSGVYDTYLLKGKTVSYVQSSTGVSEITVEWTGNKVSWYSTESAGVQLNESGTLYYYVVFG